MKFTYRGGTDGCEVRISGGEQNVVAAFVWGAICFVAMGTVVTTCSEDGHSSKAQFHRKSGA